MNKEITLIFLGKKNVVVAVDIYFYIYKVSKKS